MGGVVEGGVTSPWSASLQKVQEKLRQEFDVREESRRQLEFLEKGGDPLQFKYGNAASVSVQSTSLTQPDQFVISEAKGSFAFTASPHGDSVESIGRPGATLLCEPNSADNLLLFDGENDCVEGERGPKQYSRTAVATLEQSTQINGNRSAQELGDSAAFDVPRKAYKRRFRRRPNRDGARSSSNDARVSAGFGSFPSHNGLSDTKGVVFDAKNKAVQNGTALLTSENGGVSCKTLLSRNQDDLESGGMKAAESTTIMLKDGEHTVPDLIYSKDKVYIQPGQHSVVSSQESPIEVARVGPESLSEKGKKGPAGQLYVDSVMVENLCGSSQKNGLISAKGGRKYLSSNNETPLTSVLESELSHTHAHINHSLDGNNDREMCTNSRFLDSNGNMKIESSLPEGIINTEMKDEGESKADDNCPFIGDICKSMCENDQYIDSGLKSMEELPSSHSDLHNKVQDRNLIKRKESVTPFSEENDSKQSVRVDDDSNHQNDSTCDVSLQASIDSSIPQLVEVAPDVAVSSAPSEGRQCDVNIKLVSKADEDTILEEARIIEAKHKRITELSAVTCPTENHRKSHWDYVLEEMAWLANDVAQERLWKRTAASQISYQAAFTARSGIQEWNTSWKQKGIAQTLAKAVMGFWHSVKGSTLNQVAQCPKEGFAPAVKEYAVRFLNYNYSGPATSKQKVDSEVKGLPWENHLTEENIFYTVPPNATEMYRKSIEAHVLQYERVSSNMHKEVEMSACADLGSEDYVNEEDEGETNTYSVVFEGINPSRFAQRKHKIQMRTNKGRSYDIGADMSFSHCFENKAVNQQYMVQAKRPSSSLNVSFPTKRVRTGSRQRVLSPFIGSTSGLHLPLKAEASSGDTSSFQDDQSTLHGGPHNLNTLEDDSAGGFERQLQFDSTEAFSKPKKKKKAKFLNSSYEQRWQDNSGFQNQQRESSRKRLDGFQVEPSCSGQFGLHISKKQKIMRPSMENSFDNISPVLGSVASPVASQMSNMSNPNRIMKMLAGRDRSRKGKNPKSPAGYLTSGSQWSLFEDQALVVLVHDMGPNWELVSDAINSTLQFKCIYRKPKECRERHKILMDKTNSDAADSAEESGPSQPYPSTLPGIPKGSARQLFQRLKGPMEEDTLKSHFEKIILIGQKYLYHKTQGDNRDPKQLQQPHSSHAHALSQVFPNNMNGVPMLTPLDLCDSSPPPSSDMVSHGHQSSSTLAVSSPPAFLGGAEAASSASNSFLQGSSNIVSGNSFPSSSTSPNATVRDGRYSVSASASVSPFTEQRRNLPYNRVLPGRPNPSASPGAFPGANPGVRMLSAGSNRDGMPVVRPGFQGIIPTSPMLSSVNMIASVNIHSGVGSNNTKGNSMLRPHDALNVMQPTPQSNNNQVNPSFGGGLNTTSYSNQIPSPPTSSYPVVHPQGPNNNNVITNPQKQALLQLAKDRQLQQRLLQHQFGASNPMISPSQTTSPASSLSTTSVTPMPPSSSMTPAPHHQLKQLKHSIVPTHGLARGGAQGVAGVSSSQVVSKQRPRQTHVLQQQHSSRSHPQPRQQLPPHQQAKTVNGAGRASLLNGSASNTVQPTKLSSSITNTQVPPQSQQKIYSVKVSSQTESVQQKPSCSDDVSQGHGQPITVGPAVSCFSHQPQSHPQPRLLMSQSQPNSQRVEKHTAACSSSAGLMMSASMDCSGAADMVPDDVSAGAQAEPSNNPADDKIDSQDGPLGISRRRSSGNLSPEGKNVNVQLQQQPHTALREPLQHQHQHQHQQVLRGNSNLCDPHNNSGPD